MTSLQDLVEAGWNSRNFDDHQLWGYRVTEYLRRLHGDAVAEEFQSFRKQYPSKEWREIQALQMGMLEGLAASQENAVAVPVAPSILPTALALNNRPAPKSKRVFIVHGHDSEVKETVARFVEKLGLEPVILHEQPNEGRTLIEKFEVYSDVGFAVILLTPDDVGGLTTDPSHLRARARQNVILELGYFVGRLSRRRVCALFKKDVEIPSDFQGVVYVEIDAGGVWRLKLAQELVTAGFSITLDGLLKT